MMIGRVASRSAFTALFVVLFSLSTTPEAQGMPILKAGVIDATGHETLPCLYRDVASLSGGLLIAYDYVEEGDPQPRRAHLFNSLGKEISISVPAGARLQKIFIPRKSIGKDNYTGDTVPEGTLLEVQYRGCDMLVTPEGKMLFDSTALSLEHTQDGTLIVRNATVPICAFDGETGKKTVDLNEIERHLLPSRGYGLLINGRSLFSTSVDGSLLWGYHDADGKVVIKPIYKQAHDFDRDGMAAVSLIDDFGKEHFQFIDTTGKRISPPEFLGAEPWRNDLTVVSVRTEEGKRRYGIVNRKFEYVLKPEWSALHSMTEGCYLGTLTDADVSQVIDANGKSLHGPYDAGKLVNVSGGVFVCRVVEDVPPRLRRLRLVSADGKPLYPEPIYVRKDFNMAFGMAVFHADSMPPEFKSDVYTVVTKEGVTASGIVAHELMPIAPNALLKRIVIKEFSPRAWASDPQDRMYLYSIFLQQHNIINMKRAELETYLGKADDGNFYSMCHTMMAPFGFGLELLYDNDVVTGWRWLEKTKGRPKRHPWVTKDVIFDWSPYDYRNPYREPLDKLPLIDKASETGK